ncbi:Hypothetical predicted protein [Olea europaea subsp. europaea]|uniref:Uncharacterized protein n=1 Tax=Olea europaea subsp. europaea TaxID=158383 RepID=A0A8S0UB20_OLEEU|nr:Hypothetical predicted protein [Olea europaea subsp. europaea]
MVGKDDPVGGCTTPPGEGKRGETSGDSGGFGGNAGAEEMEEILSDGKECKDGTIKAIMIAKRKQKEAIEMMMKSIAILAEKLYRGVSCGCI